MADSESIQALSSAELYELAKQRKEEERMAEQQAAAQRLEELKAERRTLTAAYRKNVRDIDARLTALGAASKKKGTRPRKSKGNATELILQFLAAQGQASTSQIRDHLRSNGIEPSNFSQLMGNLKKRGKVVAAGRAVYAAPA